MSQAPALTVQQAADRLGVSRQRVHQLQQAGVFNPVSVQPPGGVWPVRLIPVAEVDAYEQRRAARRKQQ